MHCPIAPGRSRRHMPNRPHPPSCAAHPPNSLPSPHGLPPRSAPLTPPSPCCPLHPTTLAPGCTLSRSELAMSVSPPTRDSCAAATPLPLPPPPPPTAAEPAPAPSEPAPRSGPADGAGAAPRLSCTRSSSSSRSGCGAAAEPEAAAVTCRLRRVAGRRCGGVGSSQRGDAAVRVDTVVAREPRRLGAWVQVLAINIFG